MSINVFIGGIGLVLLLAGVAAGWNAYLQQQREKEINGKYPS